MSDPNISGGSPPEPVPSMPGSPEFPAPPAHFGPTPGIPDFGPSGLPAGVADARPMNAVGRTALVLWCVFAGVVLLGAILIVSQAVRGFGDVSPFDQSGGSGGSCVFDHEPSDRELQGCFGG